MKMKKSANLLEIGIVLLIVGVVLKVAISLAWALGSLANLALLGGVILVIIGVVTQARK